MLEHEAGTKAWWRTKPFLIMVLAGCFHVGRGAPVDGVVFLGTAGALAVAEVRGRARPPRTELPAAAALVAVPAGWLISTWRPGTVPVAVAVVLTGPPMLLLALRAGGQATVEQERSTWCPWAAVGVAICVWELASFITQSSPTVANPDHPTLSDILGPLFAHNPGRAAVIMVWLAAGALLARMMTRCTR